MTAANDADLATHASSPAHAEFLRVPLGHFELLRRSAHPSAQSLALILGLLALGLFVIAGVFAVLFAPLAVFPFFGGLLVGTAALVCTGFEHMFRRPAALPPLVRAAIRVLDVRTSASGGGQLDLRYEIDARAENGAPLALFADAAGAARLAPGACGSAAWWDESGARVELAEFRPAR
ncbi:MAG: hypothetical protein EPO68_14845 [Planctomycetota bacterium]|nr:MAG: hypothetical protein EPO68_14845 [Planctomycetota bacterium]